MQMLSRSGWKRSARRTSLRRTVARHRTAPRRRSEEPLRSGRSSRATIMGSSLLLDTQLAAHARQRRTTHTEIARSGGFETQKEHSDGDKLRCEESGAEGSECKRLARRSLAHESSRVVPRRAESRRWLLRLWLTCSPPRPALAAPPAIRRCPTT